MSVLSADNRPSDDRPVAEGRDERHPKGPEKDHGRPGPRLQGRRAEESPGKDQGGDRHPTERDAARHGDGERSLSQGETPHRITQDYTGCLQVLTMS